MSQPASPPLDIEEHRYGWVMVVVTFLLSGLAFGGLPAIAVFIKPLSLEFGWSRAEISLGYTMMAISAAVAGLLFGIISDRFGTRWSAVLGSGGMGLAYLLQSGQSTLTELYLTCLLFGATGLAIVSGPLMIGVGFWFGRNKGLAIGIVASGGGVGQAMVPVLSQWLIANEGWRDALLILGIIYLAMALPLALLVRDAPIRNEARRLAKAGEPAGNSALTNSQTGLSATEVMFWLSAAVFFCCTCMAVLIVHLVPLMTDRNIDSGKAVQVLMVVMLAGAVGRLVGGKIADIFGVLPTYFTMSVGQSAVLYWFVVIDEMALIWLFSVLFGLFFSGVMVSIVTSCREFIPPRIGARGMGVVALFGWAGMGFGGFMGGAGFDWTGGYETPFALGVVAGVVNLAVLIIFAGRIRRNGSMTLWRPNAKERAITPSPVNQPPVSPPPVNPPTESPVR